MKAFLIKLCSITPFTKKIAVAMVQLIRKLYYKIFFQYRYKVNENIVLFETFMGQQFSCSPKALYQEMINDETYAAYTKVWVFKDPEKYAYLLKNSNTVLVEYRSREYYKYCAMAKYWINNFRVPEEVWPKSNQVYVQCWHGTPLKKIGFDVENYNMANNSTQSQRKTYLQDAKKFTYALSPSDFYREKFTSAFHLKELGKEDIFIQKGYPRNDFLFTINDEIIKELKEKLAIPMNKKVILYAPTWRDNQHVAGVGYTYDLGINFDSLYEALSEEYVILFRAHYLVRNGFDFEKYNGFVIDVCDYDDINHLYAVSDLLITDYSSVFFDYANLKRPILFYMYDLEEYANEIRGFYIDLDELPGAIIRKEELLIDEIKTCFSQKSFCSQKYKYFNQKYNSFQIPCSSEVLKTVFD